eukprot:3531626-Ditylum_brightwellii.AAC.1
MDTAPDHCQGQQPTQEHCSQQRTNNAVHCHQAMNVLKTPKATQCSIVLNCWEHNSGFAIARAQAIACPCYQKFIHISSGAPRVPTIRISNDVRTTSSYILNL